MSEGTIATDCMEIGLPKWPAFVVHGEPVTREQAMEVLIRTDSWMVSTNDRGWKRMVFDVAGIKIDPKWGDADYRDMERFREEMGVLSLEYLSNKQIASCYIGGPHGWCDWRGRIGCSGYNIGKWPSVQDVAREWADIAQAFPFLRLWSQLYSDESYEDGSAPVVEFIVESGALQVQRPTPRALTPFRDLGVEIANVFRPGGERGCSLDVLKEALAHVRRVRGL
jgi:hypothetical protein